MYKLTQKLLLFVAAALLLAACGKTDLDDRSRFTGRYSVEEYSYPLQSTIFYDVRIYKAEHNEEDIVISNFYNANISVAAHIAGSRIIIPLQEIGIFDVEGFGVLSERNVINLTYYVTMHLSGGQTLTDDLVATYVKKY